MLTNTMVDIAYEHALEWRHRGELKTYFSGSFVARAQDVSGSHETETFLWL